MRATWPRLDDEQIDELQRFIDGVDRGKAEIFVGRKDELEKVEARLRTLDARKDDRWPGKDLTLVFQGAPGAGKSALLEKLASDMPEDRQDGPIAIEFNARSLCQPLSQLKSEISASLAFSRPQTYGRWRKIIGSARIGVGSTYFDVRLDSGKTEERDLREALAETPVLLLFDEIQATAHDSLKEGNVDFKKNLQWLHIGDHGLAMFPVFGGLAESGDLLRIAGLTRLSSDSEITLARFTDETSHELMAKFVKKYLSSAPPQGQTIEKWRKAMVQDCQGWPMHCRNFLSALAEQISKREWQPNGVSLDQVRLVSASKRARYYGQRMAGLLADRPGLISTVLEQLKITGPLFKGRVVDLILQAERQALDHPILRDDIRWTLPAGTEGRQAFDAMVHFGILQKVHEDQFESPIPSLASYMAARAARPSDRLHGAVIRGSEDEIESAMERCPSPSQRAELLSATDGRKRTPLILAIEAGFFPLARRLAESEQYLPEHLQSFGKTDTSGLTACDHAASSDDERIRELADPIRPNQSRLEG